MQQLSPLVDDPCQDFSRKSWLCQKGLLNHCWKTSRVELLNFNDENHVLSTKTLWNVAMRREKQPVNPKTYWYWFLYFKRVVFKIKKGLTTKRNDGRIILNKSEVVRRLGSFYIATLSINAQYIFIYWKFHFLCLNTIFLKDTS